MIWENVEYKEERPEYHEISTIYVIMQVKKVCRGYNYHYEDQAHSQLWRKINSYIPQITEKFDKDL